MEQHFVAVINDGANRNILELLLELQEKTRDQARFDSSAHGAALSAHSSEVKKAGAPLA